MRRLAILLVVLIFLPAVSFAAPLTETQSESLINVVRSSPDSPASAFTSLVTAFSDITQAQAASLIEVIQASPSSPASAFLGLLTSFTQVPLLQKSTGSAANVTSSGGITCDGVHYDPCGSDSGTPVCLDNGSNAYCRPPQPLPVATEQNGPEPFAPQFGQDQLAQTIGSLQTQMQQKEATTQRCYASLPPLPTSTFITIELQSLLGQYRVDSLACEEDAYQAALLANEILTLEGKPTFPVSPPSDAQTHSYPEPTPLNCLLGPPPGSAGSSGTFMCYGGLSSSEQVQCTYSSEYLADPTGPLNIECSVPIKCTYASVSLLGEPQGLSCSD